MNDVYFVDKVKKNFGYLETEYNFSITHESNSDIRGQTDGLVEYSSDTTVVVIDSETGAVAVWLYRIKDGRRYDLDPVIIDEYLNTSDKEKELLLSTNPQDYAVALQLFNQKFLLNQPEWKVGSSTTDRKLDVYLENYADWLKAHADLCLKGDFSTWPKFYAYKINRARADHLRRGKDELGYTRAKSADGNWKLIKQSIFKEKLDHVERLKKEFEQKE